MFCRMWLTHSNGKFSVLKKQFQNLDIQCWEHTSSHLGVNRPFICLQADSLACAPLLTALDELLSEESPARLTLTLKPCPRPNACSSIKLCVSQPSNELQQMFFTINQNAAVLEFTAPGLMMFRAAVESWRDGAEDFSIHPRRTAQKEEFLGANDLVSGEVWFWTPSTSP